MSCPQVDLVDLYALGALSTHEAAPIVLHIASCAACRREYQSLQPVVKELPNWPSAEIHPSPFLWERLARRIRYEARADSNLRGFTDGRDTHWEQAAPGLQFKLLSTDTDCNRVSMLVMLEAGVDYPPHSHAGVEELHLLDGELWIDDRLLFPGDYHRAEAGTTDQRVWSETGCTCVLITSTSDSLS
jgi:anti-sigma factor ChrR (cupin superfamily)